MHNRLRFETSPYEAAVSRSGYRWLWAEYPPHPDREQIPRVLRSGGPETGPANFAYHRVLLPCEFDPKEVERRRLTRADAGIHREFAELGTNEDSISGFAGRYGPLRGRQLADITALFGRPALWRVDLLNDWASEIEAARRAIALWDSTNKGKNATGAVLAELAALIDGRLGCELRPVARPDQRALAPRLEPATLGGAIWLAIFAETARAIEVVRCRHCGRWFSFDPQAVKHDPFLCSPACRSAAYRKRQAEARELAGQGLSIPAIARRLGSAEERVTRWVGAR